MRLRSLLVVLVLVAGQAARAASCDCAPCPLESGRPCQSEPTPPCCGEPVPEEMCSCSHVDAPESVPASVEAATRVASIDAAVPDIVLAETVAAVGSFPPRGPGPPSTSVPLYLRDLSLRI